jgi:hypothetical protein
VKKEEKYPRDVQVNVAVVLGPENLWTGKPPETNKTNDPTVRSMREEIILPSERKSGGGRFSIPPSASDGRQRINCYNEPALA